VGANPTLALRGARQARARGVLPNTQVDAVLRALPLSWLDSALLLIRSLAACACLRTSALGSSRIRRFAADFRGRILQQRSHGRHRLAGARAEVADRREKCRLHFAVRVGEAHG
jgi:hypothetical protein